MTGTIDKEMLRDLFEGLNTADLDAMPNAGGLWEFLRTLARIHPEEEVSKYLVNQLNWLERQLFPERFEDDAKEN